MSGGGELLTLKCEVCDKALRDKPYQSIAKVRTCSPACAGALFKKEHPNWGCHNGAGEGEATG